jgi:hypothetical protein
MNQARHAVLVVIGILLFGLVIWTPKTVKQWCYWGIAGIILFGAAYILH